MQFNNVFCFAKTSIVIIWDKTMSSLCYVIEQIVVLHTINTLFGTQIEKYGNIDANKTSAAQKAQ